MLQYRSTILAFAAALALSLSPLALAQQTAPSAAQVEQLQAQLADMQKEMAAMRKTIESSADIPAEKRQMMGQHMGQMEKNWQGMHDQCCMMNPAGCSQMGTAGRQ